jgi:hypothetical protein
MNAILIRIIVDCAAFLELSDDSVVDRDAAVQQLEQIASMLEKLSPSEQAEIVNHIKTYALEEGSARGKGRYWQFLENLPDALGLQDDTKDF